MSAHSYSVVDPSAFSTMEVIEVPDKEAILSARMQSYVETWARHDPPMGAQYDVQNLEFDPHKIVQEASTVYEENVRNRINQAARATTLAFAGGRDLDAIASRMPFPVPRVASEIYDYQTALFPERTEKDARYRTRIWLAPFKLSRGATPQGYAFDALSFVPDARDVSVTAHRTPQQVTSIVTLLMNRLDDPKPTKAELLAAFKSLDAPDLVANTDVLAVKAVSVLRRHYVYNLYFLPYTDHDAIMAQTAKNATELLDDKLFYLGRDHGRQQIAGAANLPGVHHVELEGFDGEVIEASETQVIRATFEVKPKGTRK